MRKPFIAGNWKMYKTVAQALELVAGLKQTLGDVLTMDLAVCPPATALAAVSGALAGSNIGVGAQNMYWRTKGRSRRECRGDGLRGWRRSHPGPLGSGGRLRRGLHETRQPYQLKSALAHGITPIVCIGESLEQNKAGETVSFVGSQMRGAFADISAEDAAKVVLAYEPIWAIGTGLTATPEDANRIIKAAIRDVLTALYERRDRRSDPRAVRRQRQAGQHGRLHRHAGN
jgi:triosephosphate isomerase